MKVIVETIIKTNLSESEVMRIAQTRSDHFKKVPGLIGKYWLRDFESKTFYGIFEFENKGHVERYLETDFAKSVAEAYKTTEPVKVLVLEVLKYQGRS